MKALAKHKSLYTLVKWMRWGLVATNEYEEIRKDHLLDMRKDKLVLYLSPNKMIKGNMDFFDKYRGKRIEGSDWNSYFYGITFKGLFLVRNMFPDLKESCNEMILNVFEDVFNGEFDDWRMRL